MSHSYRRPAKAGPNRRKAGRETTTASQEADQLDYCRDSRQPQGATVTT